MHESTPAPVERPTRIRWLIIFMACAASFLLYLHRYSWGVIKPSFRRDNPDFTDTQIGWLDSAFGIAYAVAQIPAGVAADIYGPRLVVAGFIVFWSAAVAGLAWVGGLWNVAAVRAALGVAQAGAYPALSKVTRSWCPIAVRTSLQGIVTSMGRVGAACSSLILATLLIGMLGLDWRTALVTLAVPGLALGVAWWWLVRDNPRGHPGVNAAGRIDRECRRRMPSSTPQRALLLNRGSVLNLGMMLFYAFASAFQDQLYVNWTPSFLTEGKGLNSREMGLFNMLPLLGGAVGGVCGGFLNDRLIRSTGNRRWSRSGVAFAGKFISGCLVMLAVQMHDGRAAAAVLMVARFFGDWSLPTQWGAITDISGRASATVFGLVNAVGAIGIFVAGPVFGALKQNFGWEGLFLGASAMCVLSAVTWLFIDCNRKLVGD